ncbi:MAG: hypothetical protein R6V06_05355 [Kiritimatiellia bacterium]
MPVTLPFNLTQQNGQKADPLNLRVRFCSGSVSAAQFETDTDTNTVGQLIFCIPEGLPAKDIIQAEVLGTPEGCDRIYPHVSSFSVSIDGSVIDMGSYSAGIRNGMLGPVSIKTGDGTDMPVMSELIASSKTIGWTGEKGEVESMTCRHSGPVRSVFSCVKHLKNSHRLTRIWYFYPDRFEVHSSCEPHVPSLNRAHYIIEATVSTDDDRSVQMDGKGKFEKFTHKKPPAWYAIYSEVYRNACIALSKPGSFTYWDSGSRLGQISLNHTGKGMEKRVYLWGRGTKDDSFAREAAKAYKQGIVVE